MSRLTRTAVATALLFAVTPGLSTAQGMDPLQAAVKARQSHMFLDQYNLMTLGGMAQGGIPYDSATAAQAAANILALTSIDEAAYFLPGTSADEMEGTRALPAIWANPEDVAARAEALAVAAQAMAAAAGTDLAALQGAMGGLAQSCGGCHEAYRVAQ